ncbi:glycosyltransferase [Pyruvatibacter sp. HU-CL02332]|uniref:glycosyltransferase n=1 Tax=Pyruvatibacter sp. HU-CL02332 TaxID=3127650 RepID=UPI0033659BB0
MSANKPNLMFLIRSLETGGAERQLVALANGLADTGWAISVVTYYPGGDLEGTLSPRIARHDLGKTSRWHLIGPLLTYLSLIRRIRPQAVHSYMDSANLLAAALRLFAKPHKLIWGIRTSDMRDGHQDALQKLLFRLETRLSRSADLIIANSQTGLAFAQSQGLSTSNGIAIRNGINTEKFSRNEQAGTALRNSLGIPAVAPVISIVARLDPVKGHGVLLEAFSILEDKHTHLIIAGGGPDTLRTGLEEQAASLGITDRVHFLGNVTDTQAVYSASDIAVLSSLYGEGTPNAPAEAMACGTPCVVTELGDGPFVVGDTGETAPPGDAQALSTAIGHLLHRVRSEPDLRHRARTRIEEELSVSKLIADTEAALERALEK